MQFSTQEESDPLNPSTGPLLKFLSLLFKEGKSYSCINTAKSAISSICGLVTNRNIGDDLRVKRFMRGIFTKRPKLPQYGHIWDVNIVFDYLRTLPSNESLSLLKLSEKLVILLLLLSGQRGQTIHLLKISDVHIDDDSVTLFFSSLTTPKRHLDPLVLEKYKVDEKLCVVASMKTYLERTSGLRDSSDDKLLISTVPPHKGVTKSTVSRWIKSIMTQSGIDTNYFRPHSCRAASTSKARNAGKKIGAILKAAGWSTAKTFKQFYSRVIGEGQYGKAILQPPNTD